MTISNLAHSYHASVHAAATSPVPGEEEAQLTTPISNLFIGVSALAGLGVLRLVRETRLDRTRPDFAAVLIRNGKSRQKGFIELKAPNISVDTATWLGRNRSQWENMRREAEILIVTNGAHAQLYKQGEPVGLAATLPYTKPDQWDSSSLAFLLQRFFDLNPTPIVDVSDLSRRLAMRTADLRDRLLWLFGQVGPASEAAKGGYRSWCEHVYPHSSMRDFADSVSQVVAYGMVLAALLDPGKALDADGLLTVANARAAVRQFSPVLAAAFAPLIDKPILAEATAIELGALETLVSAIDSNRVNVSADLRGEPWLYFYEDFLSVYDPDARRQAGVYYTPVAIVQAMVNMTDYLLVTKFGKRLSFADPAVMTLDPAAGTGAFPLSVIDRAVERAVGVRGKAGGAQAAVNLANNLFAFELLPGPYSVAHLRLSQRLTMLAHGSAHTAKVILTDTLESPLAPSDQLALFGDAEVLATEQNRAKSIKLDQRVTVVIGNPPYRRVERDADGRGAGGWVLNGEIPNRGIGKSLFDDILDVARAHTVFSHHASLYNLYVYFWRWAIWKAFEAHGPGPAIVSFITGASWLTGPGFVGLRKLVREMCDDVWILDLGGDNHGANPEENVFAIETPVAVVVLARNDTSDRSQPARVHYRRISGGADVKLAAMATVAAASAPFDGDWIDAPSGWLETFTPPTSDVEWMAMPLLTDIFPWQQPGCKFGRTWPIAPLPGILKSRWGRFSDAAETEKSALFVTGTSGRNIKTKVEGLPRLITVKAGDAARPIVRYSYRSFDRQWAFNDPRMAKTESPSLWETASSSQIFLCSLLTGQIGPGPALTVATDIPDLHYFRGSHGGKDIVPIWRDAEATEPNLTRTFAEMIGKFLNIPQPTVAEIASYVYAILSSPAYQVRFAAALRTPGLRVPITANRKLWDEAVKAGQALLWLHTFGERFRDVADGRGPYIPILDEIAWEIPVTTLPADITGIKYDQKTLVLHVGDGQLSGVRAEVWEFEVSGMPVLKKWLGYRTRRGAGRAVSSSSNLDHVRPLTWCDDWNDELLDLVRILTLTLDRQPALESLLQRICQGQVVSAKELPKPTAAERQPPRVTAALTLSL